LRENTVSVPALYTHTIEMPSRRHTEEWKICSKIAGDSDDQVGVGAGALDRCEVRVELSPPERVEVAADPIVLACVEDSVEVSVDERKLSVVCGPPTVLVGSNDEVSTTGTVE
jgi:hypothetical protein